MRRRLRGAKTLFLEKVFDRAFVQTPGLAWGAPVCPPGPGAFVLVCSGLSLEAEALRMKSPPPPKKSCFFRPAPPALPRKTQAHNCSHSHQLGTQAPVSEGADRRGERRQSPSENDDSLPPSHTCTHTSLLQLSQVRWGLCYWTLLPFDE